LAQHTNDVQNTSAVRRRYQRKRPWLTSSVSPPVA